MHPHQHVASNRQGAECRKRGGEREKRVQRFVVRSHTRAGGEDVRLLHALGLDVPAGEVVLQHADETFFWVVAQLRAARPDGTSWWWWWWGG